MSIKVDDRKLKKKMELELAKLGIILDFEHFNIREKLVQNHFVNSFLENWVDINYKIPSNSNLTDEYGLRSGNTLLHTAVLKYDSNFVEKLLNQGADFTIQNTEGKTALHVGFELITDWDCLWCYVNGRNGKRMWIDQILNAHVRTGNSLNPSCNNGITHFHLACRADHIEAVKFFLKSGTPVNQAIHMDSPMLPGFTPLHIAARYCCLETAKILLDYGADLDCKDFQGLNPLHVLLRRKVQIPDMMLMGLENCQSFINDKDNIDTLIGLFLKFKKINLINKVDELGISSFHIACTMEDQSVAENLVKQVDINAAVNADSPIFPGYTAAHFSAHFMFSSINLLLKNGMDLYIKDAQGITPIDLCLDRYDPKEFVLPSEIADIEFEGSTKDILTSNKITKIGDFILSMRSPDEFRSITKKNVETAIPHNSPLWAGYTPMHLMVLFENRYKYMYGMNEENDDIGWIKYCIENGHDSCKKAVNECTPLHLAFKLKNKKIVDLILIQKRLQNPVDSNNLSHFHIACMTKNKEAIEHFLKMEVDVNSPVKCDLQWLSENYLPKISNRVSDITIVRSNSTPLHMAVISGNEDIIKLLLYHGANRYATDEDGLTPIHLSIRLVKRSIKSVNLLLSDVNLEDRLVEKFNLSHLHVACAVNNIEAIDKLLDQGANINLAISPSFLTEFKGQTPLHIASSEETIRLLINRNADIYTKNANGESVVQLLLDTKSQFIGIFKEKLKLDVQIGNGITLLHLACASLDFEWTKYLLENEVNVNAKINFDYSKWPGYTPLHVLIDKFVHIECKEPTNFIPVVEILLKYGADVTSVDANGLTPVHLTHESVFSTYDKSVINTTRLLLKNQKSYKVNPATVNGVSHLHLACAINETEIIEEFLRNGIDPNDTIDPFVKNLGGYTPLHFAAENKNKRAIEILLKYGADVLAETCFGDTPLHLAVKGKLVRLDKYTTVEYYSGERLADLENRDGYVESGPISLIVLLVSNGADLSAKNLYYEKPLETLISSRGLRVEHVHYFTELGYSFNDFNPATSEGFIAKIIEKYKVDGSLWNNEIYSAIMNIPDIKNQVEDSCSIMHNIVSIYNTRFSTYQYTDFIEKILNIGFELDQQDKNGRTPLHLAVNFENSEAVESLLILGADLDIIDKNGKSPYVNSIGTYRYFSKNKQVLTRHLRKMLRNGLRISTVNEKILDQVMEEYKTSEMYEESREANIGSDQLKCDKELSKIAEIHFGAHWTLKSFLTNSIVYEYRCISPILRQTIDKFFISAIELRKQYPFYGSLLMLQYRRANVRCKLLETAKITMNSLGIRIPDLCFNVIFQYLENYELKVLIQAMEE